MITTDVVHVSDYTTPTKKGYFGYDDEAFYRAINVCLKTGGPLYIPAGKYTLEKKIFSPKAFDIYSDSGAFIRWVNPDDCGILFDLTSSPHALCSIQLPNLFGPAVDDNFSIPGYSFTNPTYDEYTRCGTALMFVGGNRFNVTVHHIVGWERGIVLESTNQDIANVNVNVNTIDFCKQGISLTGNRSTQAVVANANTIWAKYPIYLNGDSQLITANRLTIAGQAFTNEYGGCGIFAIGGGDNISANTFDINWLAAGYKSDSPPGTPTDLLCPFIGGTSGECNIEGVGCFYGMRNKIRIGAANIAVPEYAYQHAPKATDSDRIRYIGSDNDVEILFV